MATHMALLEGFRVHVFAMGMKIFRWRQCMHGLALPLLESVRQGVFFCFPLLVQLSAVLLNVWFLGLVIQKSLQLVAWWEWLHWIFHNVPRLILSYITPVNVAIAFWVLSLLHLIVLVQMNQRGVQYCSQREALVMAADHRKAYVFQADVVAKLADHPFHRRHPSL